VRLELGLADLDSLALSRLGNVAGILVRIALLLENLVALGKVKLGVGDSGRLWLLATTAVRKVGALAAVGRGIGGSRSDRLGGERGKSSGWRSLASRTRLALRTCQLRSDLEMG
jgi:hypothetical protein